MRKRWKAALAAALLLALVLLGADIRYGIFSGGRCRLPVLMYHHFAQEGDGGFTVSGARFREQMEAMKTAGYHAVTVRQVLDYVRQGTPLPDKPVLITMDDGYTSNLDIAAPILEELDLCATVFVIGINEGEAVYVHSGEALTPPRFSYEEAALWVEKGVLDLQSHTYDLHQRTEYGFSGREGVLRMEGESAAQYREALAGDMALYRRRREGRVSTPLTALSYPFGLCSRESDRILENEGIALTVTIQEHCNTIYTGHPRTLRRLGRFNMDESVTGEALVRKLERAQLP